MLVGISGWGLLKYERLLAFACEKLFCSNVMEKT